MKKFRKIIFWCHLPVGALAGVVILIMCVTGVLLSYEKQITSWADTRGYRSGVFVHGLEGDRSGGSLVRFTYRNRFQILRAIKAEV